MEAGLRDSLSLLRRMPPQDVKTNLDGLCVLRPDLADELLHRVDTPLEMRVDASNKKAYLLCDYNRDGDSHRSPWSNTYEPALPDEGFKPSAPLRELEVAANELLEVYCGLYYGGGSAHSGDTVASSAYFWQLDDVGPAAFGSCWLVKKVIGGGGAGRALNSGSWDAIHVLEVTPAEASPAAGGAAGIPTAAPTKWLYKLTSTLIFNLHVAHACSASSSTSSAPSGDRGAMQLSGCLSRQTSLTAALTLGKGHVAHIGGLVETMESELRTSLDQLYISKTREAVAALHSGGSHDGSPASAGQHARSGIAGGVALPGLGSALQHHSSSTSSGASGGSAHPAELVGDLRAALASRTAT